jgi:hypothetical protein
MFIYFAIFLDAAFLKIIGEKFGGSAKKSADL